MASIPLSPGTRTLTVPITMLPSGQSGQAQVFLSSDAGGLTLVATGTLVSFSSTGALQNVALPIVIGTAGGIYYAWVAVYQNARPLGSFSQTDTVTIGSVTVGQGSWT